MGAEEDGKPAISSLLGISEAGPGGGASSPIALHLLITKDCVHVVLGKVGAPESKSRHREEAVFTARTRTHELKLEATTQSVAEIYLSRSLAYILTHSHSSSSHVLSTL